MKLKNLKIYLLAIFAIFLFNLQITAMHPHPKPGKSQSEKSKPTPVACGTIKINGQQLWRILYHDENHKKLRTILSNNTKKNAKLTASDTHTSVSNFEYTKNPSYTCAYNVKIEITTTSINKSTIFTATLTIDPNDIIIHNDQHIELNRSDTQKHFFLCCCSEKKSDLNKYSQAINAIIPDTTDQTLLDIVQVHDANKKRFKIYTLYDNKIHVFSIKYPDNIELDPAFANMFTSKIKKQFTFSSDPILHACSRFCNDYNYTKKEIQERLGFYKSKTSTEKEKKSSDENNTSSSDSENLFLTQRCRKEKEKEKELSDEKERKISDENDTSSSDSEDIISRNCRKYKKEKEHSNEKERKSNDEDDTSNNNSSRSFFSLSSDNIISNSSNVFIQQIPRNTFDIDINTTTLPTAWFNSTSNSAKNYFLNIIKNNADKPKSDQQSLLNNMMANLDNVNMNYEGSILSINPSPSIKQLVSFTIGSQNPTRLFGSFNYKVNQITLETDNFNSSEKSNFQKFLSRGLQHSKQNDDVHASIKKPDQNTPQTYVTLSNNIINIIINVAQKNSILYETIKTMFESKNMNVNYVQQTGNDYLIWISNTATNKHYIFVINFSNDQINQN